MSIAKKAMSMKRSGILAIAIVFSLVFTAQAAATPVWGIDAFANTNVAVGGQAAIQVEITNVGNAPTAAGAPSACTAMAPGCVTVVAEFPPGTNSIQGIPVNFGQGFSCSTAGQVATCISPQRVFGYPDSFAQLAFTADVDPGATGILTPSFSVYGGGATLADGSACASAATPPPSAPPCASTVQPLHIADGVPAFGLDAFDGQLTSGPGGATYVQAGGTPYYASNQIVFNSDTDPLIPDLESPGGRDGNSVEPPKNIVVDLPPGLVGNPSGLPECTIADLVGRTSIGLAVRNECDPAAQVGSFMVLANTGVVKYAVYPVAVYNMEPPPGSPARFAFNYLGTVVTLDATIRSEGGYGVRLISRNTPEAIGIRGVEATFWGDPTDASHDAQRPCPGKEPPYPGGVGPSVGQGGTGNLTPCTDAYSRPPSFSFLRLPTSCEVPIGMSIHADSWADSAAFMPDGSPDLGDPTWAEASFLYHDLPGFPASPEDPSTPWGGPHTITGCDKVPIRGELTATPTTPETQTPSGLSVHVEVPSPGLGADPEHIRPGSSDIRKVKVTLPEGMTVNPSQAEGLGACSPAQLESTRLEFHPDGAHGCPSDSKIGTVNVKTPLLDEEIPGDVYIASPYDNPFNSLLALYVVLHNEQRGVLVKLAGEVQTDPTTGQITTIFDDLPQLPFSTFDFKFREGARAPLVTPQACGTYETKAEFTGHSDPNGPPLVSTSTFEIVRGIGGGACPSGGLPPFKPGLIAGSVNNRAGAYSPFNVRLFRSDAEQEMVNFSIKLPPGIAAKLAGVPFCSDAAIAASKTKSGAQELASPSCPKASEIGRTLVGAGVGSVQTYVPGKVYLAGAYNGSALSIASVTAAKVGPFDLGTVVVRLALRVDPETAEVFVDPTGSDPIPHIIDGITTHIRDIRAYVDKNEFALNPTSCDPTSTASTVLGSGLDFSSDVDDRPVTVSTRYQVADCAALAFKPKLSFSLKGATTRGGNPALRAVLKMKGGQANIKEAQVTLPRSEFLDQSHIGTVCTRVQYAADACPARSVYGYARAFTPILDEPLQGPVYLRSSRHTLPDLVAGLKSGKIEIDLVGRIDSPDGRIRNTFEAVPDAPVSKFVLTMKGGKKGLLENSTNLCKSTNRATAAFDAHNGKISDYRPIVKAKCAKAGKSGKTKRPAR